LNVLDVRDNDKVIAPLLLLLQNLFGLPSPCASLYQYLGVFPLCPPFFFAVPEIKASQDRLAQARPREFYHVQPLLRNERHVDKSRSWQVTYMIPMSRLNNTSAAYSISFTALLSFCSFSSILNSLWDLLSYVLHRRLPIPTDLPPPPQPPFSNLNKIVLGGQMHTMEREFHSCILSHRLLNDADCLQKNTLAESFHRYTHASRTFFKRNPIDNRLWTQWTRTDIRRDM
jgi:hypothetical protein